MARIDADGVYTLWAPTSFFDPLNDRVNAAIKVGYQATICHALLYKLATRAGIDSLLASMSSASRRTKPGSMWSRMR